MTTKKQTKPNKNKKIIIFLLVLGMLDLRFQSHWRLTVIPNHFNCINDKITTEHTLCFFNNMKL